MENLFPKLRLACRGLPCEETVYMAFSFQKLEQWEVQTDYNCLLLCCAVPMSEWNKSFFFFYCDVLLHCVCFFLPNIVFHL